MIEIIYTVVEYLEIGHIVNVLRSALFMNLTEGLPYLCENMTGAYIIVCLVAIRLIRKASRVLNAILNDLNAVLFKESQRRFPSFNWPKPQTSFPPTSGQPFGTSIDFDSFETDDSFIKNPSSITKKTLV